MNTKNDSEKFDNNKIFDGAILFEKMPEFVYDWEDERGCITPD
jgi:hypothetical protein